MRSSALVVLALLCGCGPSNTVELKSDRASVSVKLDPFELTVRNGKGEILKTVAGAEGQYGATGGTVEFAKFKEQIIPGWDGYIPGEGAWGHPLKATVLSKSDKSVSLGLTDGVLSYGVEVLLDGERIRLISRVDSTDEQTRAPNKTGMAFALPEDEHFFGLGERYASTDHRGLSLYSWAEEAGLGAGENATLGAQNPYPNGPSMTYFPVPFFHSSKGYALHINTTYRSELHLGSERQDAWRLAVFNGSYGVTVYVGETPLRNLELFTEDTGRAKVPAPWVFGPRRRINWGEQVDGVDEWRKMRDLKIPITAIDDAVHLLPHNSHFGKEAGLATWTATLHQHGFKVNAYNNPYVSASLDSAKELYEYGKSRGLFVKGPDGEPSLTFFVSGAPQHIAAIDLTNPEGVSWFQALLKRTLDLGYDGWMHDFGEYTARNARFFDGRSGHEVHNEYPVLSAKAAFELMERERPNDFLFFVRSGYTGTQAVTPAVWGGDPEATFDETQGLPAMLRGGVNLGLSGVPFWGSDIGGFKCFSDGARDKDVYLRWVQFGAMSPIMMDQDACYTLSGHQPKWSMWSDAETTVEFAKMSRLHTRLQPYFLVLAKQAQDTGAPLMRHPFLLFPEDRATWAVDDAFFLGDSLYVMPVVRRAVTVRKGYLPQGRYTDFEDGTLYEGGGEVAIPAPLTKLPLLLVENRLVPMLDAEVETLAPAPEPTVVSADKRADRLDVIVALAPGGEAKMTLLDGTELVARRGEAGAASGLTTVAEAELAACSRCASADVPFGGVVRARANSSLSASEVVTIGDLTLEHRGGPARRIRWDVRKLP